VSEAAGKCWYRSRTVWFNLVCTLPLLLDAAAQNLGLLQPLIPVRWYPLMAAVITLANLWLRSVTTSGITLRQAES